MLNQYNLNGWIFFRNKATSIDNSDIVGKYLFFSENKQQLIELGKQLLLEYNLPSFKVPEEDKEHGFTYVMCLYSNNDNLKNTLRKHQSELIAYQYFKSDADTKAGKYSDKWKNSLKS